MISTGEGWVWQHNSGRYFVSHWNHPCIPGTACHDPDQQPEISYSLTHNPFAATTIYNRDWWGEKWLTRNPEWQLVADQFEVVPGPGCACCGERWLTMHGHSDNWRCGKHRDRNPCAIEGCKRTTAAPEGQLATDQWLCSEHWRLYCPPRSMRRRLYHRYFRKAKWFGWTPELERSFWRFWDRLVADARKRATDGYIDETEINRIFGWGDAA